MIFDYYIISEKIIREETYRKRKKTCNSLDIAYIIPSCFIPRETEVVVLLLICTSAETTASDSNFMHVY